jgi:hypothetical protein
MARVGEPFNLTAEALSIEEVVQDLRNAIDQRLQAGAQLVWLPVGPTQIPGGKGGTLPDDDLTREWLQAVEEYRQECDVADRERILGEVSGEKEEA